MSNWDFTVATGNPEIDRQTVDAYRQQAAAQGLHFDAQSLPSGGYRVSGGRVGGGSGAGDAGASTRVGRNRRASTWGAHQPGSGGSAPNQPGWAPNGQPAAAGAAAMAFNAAPPFAGGALGANSEPIEARRVAYLRRVYSLLAGSALVAIVCGLLAMNVGPTDTYYTNDGVAVQVPILVALLGTRLGWIIAFGVLTAAIFGASAVSKVRGLNVVALFGVAAIMGFELAPMVFVANVFAGLGRTMTADPVRDAFVMVGAVFAGITSYIYITRKDFSYLRATLTMGFWVIFAACILGIFVESEAFSLAVASAGALLSGGFLLYVTSYTFRNSEMDDPVGDALAVLVQLRNLFMFILRIFMSSRD
jgi:modulator of FtsH protease